MTQETLEVGKVGLTGEENADDLRRLAEVFEVREALERFTASDERTGWQVEPDDESGFAGMLTAAAERLHAAGWRPGMTAEDAAVLLSMPAGWRVEQPDANKYAAAHHGPRGHYLHKLWRDTPREAAEDAGLLEQEGGWT